MDHSFKNAEIVKKANIYFDGKVTSRTVFCADGKRMTLGFMTAGAYDFSTKAAEKMEILGGEMVVSQAGKTNTYHSGDVFYVPSDSSYHAVVDQYADYCCSYED